MVDSTYSTRHDHVVQKRARLLAIQQRTAEILSGSIRAKGAVAREIAALYQERRTLEKELKEVSRSVTDQTRSTQSASSPRQRSFAEGTMIDGHS